MLRFLGSTRISDVSAEYYLTTCLRQESYASNSKEDAFDFLAGEVDCVTTAAKVALSLGARPATPYTLSVGATPTAHAIDMLTASSLPGTLEL